MAGEGGQNVVRVDFRDPQTQQRRKVRPLFAKPPPDTISEPVVFPHRRIDSVVAVQDLSRFLPCPIGPLAHLELRFPPKVFVRMTPSSIEFYDTSSSRPAPREPSETGEDISRWVKSWYFSLEKREDGSVVGRFMNRSYGEVLSEPFELVVHRPDDVHDSPLDSFISAIESRENAQVLRGFF